MLRAEVALPSRPPVFRGLATPRLREVAIRKLEEGDPHFWRMLLDRIWPTKLELTNEMREPLVVRWQSPLDLEVAPKD